MYSTYNEGKSVVAERFIRTLKKKIFKHITAISKNVLDDIVKKYNNTVHKTIKMKPIEVTGNFYVESNKNAFNKDSMKLHSIKLHLNAKGYTPNWSEEVFVIKKVKDTVSWTYAINDLNGEEITGSFYEK